MKKRLTDKQLKDLLNKYKYKFIENHFRPTPITDKLFEKFGIKKAEFKIKQYKEK